MGAENHAGSDWLTPPPDNSLGPDEVHVWRVGLKPCDKTIVSLGEVLSEGEKALSEGMGSDEIRRRYVVSHAAQRLILGRYLGQRPARITFSEGGSGKPILVTGRACPEISFNLSHSGDLALLAVADQRVVGIDLERVRPAPLHAEIAARYFSPHEYSEWIGLADEERLEGFFLGWTRKEAYSKALGLGVSRCWTRFHVSLTPGAPVMLADDEWGHDKADRYELRELNPGNGYVGAVATQGTGWRLRCYDWCCDLHGQANP